MTPEEIQEANRQFLATIDKIVGLHDDAERAAVGVQIFGRGWQHLRPIMDRRMERYR
jgi:hypothetical protein